MCVASSRTSARRVATGVRTVLPRTVRAQQYSHDCSSGSVDNTRAILTLMDAPIAWVPWVSPVRLLGRRNAPQHFALVEAEFLGPNQGVLA